MTDLDSNQWTDQDGPLLAAFARASRSDDGRLLLEDATRDLGVRVRDVMASFDTLKRTGFLDAHFSHDNSGEFSHIRLTERGLRQTRLWPTPETALDRMIAALEAIADNTDEDEDTRTRARKILDGLGGAGRQIGISVAAAAIGGQIPGV